MSVDKTVGAILAPHFAVSSQAAVRSCKLAREHDSRSTDDLSARNSLCTSMSCVLSPVRLWQTAAVAWGLVQVLSPVPKQRLMKGWRKCPPSSAVEQSYISVLERMGGVQESATVASDRWALYVLKGNLPYQNYLHPCLKMEDLKDQSFKREVLLHIKKRQKSS